MITINISREEQLILIELLDNAQIPLKLAEKFIVLRESIRGAKDGK